MLVALMTAFTFTSCEDVPAPYDIPNGGNGGETTTEVAEGNGTVDSPYNPLAVVQYIKSLEAGVNSSDYYTSRVSFLPQRRFRLSSATPHSISLLTAPPLAHSSTFTV